MVSSDQRSKKLRKEFYENKYGPKRQGMYRGTNFVSGAQLDAEDAQRRELEMQKLKNQGQLAVEDRRQVGGTTRTNLEQAGLDQRFKGDLGFRQDELNQQEADADRLYDLEKFKVFSTSEAVGVPADPMQKSAQFEALQELSNPKQNKRIQDNQGSGWVERANGSKLLVDPTGKISQPVASSDVNLNPLSGHRPDPGLRAYEEINRSINTGQEPAFNESAYEKYLKRKKRMEEYANRTQRPQSAPPNLQGNWPGLAWMNK